MQAVRAVLFRNRRTEFQNGERKELWQNFSFPTTARRLRRQACIRKNHAGGAFCGCCRGVQAAQRPDARAHFWLLSHQEACVINLAAMLEMSSPAVSHHLRSLTESGLLVNRRRDGKEVYYRAADTEESRLLHEIVERVMEIACPEKAVDFQASQGGDHPPRAHLSHGASFRAHHDRGAVARVSDEYNDAEKRLQARLRLVHRAAYEAAPHGGGRRT